MSDKQRVMHQFIDEGAGRDPGRPGFGRLVAALHKERAADPDEPPPSVVVSELSRLFRNRQDRATVDELVASRVADVFSVREDIDTAGEAGRERYRRAADLLVLAYDGTPLEARTRRELADRYTTEVLDAWLELVGTPQERRAAPLADVRARLLGLARRWGTPEARTLIAPYLELAQLHEPTELDIAVRQLALVGVRNSDLETLHMDRYIHDEDWRVITQAAAYALSGFAALPAGDCSSHDDPFAGIAADYPTAAAAFTVLADMCPGDEREWQAPQRDLPAVPVDTVAVEVTREGFDVQHAMDPRLSRRVVAVLANRVGERGAYGVPSLKHISRNPRKLFRVVDFLLAHGSVVVTANVFIEPGRITRRADPASYNELDLSWAGFEYDRAFAAPGRNDPCPCGSGLKYKRCCGR